MISRIHNKLGTAGLVVAIVALVAALTGAAFAAGGGLTTKEKKEVKKIAKKFAGKPGPQGPQGPAGPAGKDGTNGTSGTNGKSVVIGTATAGQCPSGGSTVEVEGSGTKKPICNGKTGFTETLPSGETETGTWAIGNDDGPSIIPLTFNIPLAEAPDALHYVDPSGEEVVQGTGEIVRVPATHCLGSAEEPTAPAGEICVYADEESLNSAEYGYRPEAFFEHLYTSGATFFFFLLPEEGFAFGTWAVTAE